MWPIPAARSRPQQREIRLRGREPRAAAVRRRPNPGRRRSGTTGGSGTTGASGAAGAAAKAGGTYDGDVVQTRFGTVQVQITVKAGQITDVTALKLTDAEGRSVQISNYAAPVLRDEVLQAQSADVQTVGGATVTSDAYLTSLQAALDAANL
jgi:uncharacterized protein with FMN-binding domain